MILVLTYHRVVENPAAINSFFDVTAGELDGHIRIARELWGKCAAPGDLLQAAPGRRRERQGFLVTFDDGTLDHLTVAAPVLERQEARGVFFVSTNRLGREGFLSAAQCRELVARGHAVESHSHDHKQLTTFAGDEVRRQLSESRRVLSELGLSRWNFLAVPGGAFNESIVQAATGEGYALLRTLEWGYNRASAPLRVESITINRKTCGRWFRPLIKPQFEFAKKFLYRSKELLKGGRLKSFYYGMRDSKQN